MGSFEKLVVLTVLFLVALVLGVTLNSGEPEAAGPAFDGPLDSARHLAERGDEGFLSRGSEPSTEPAGLALLNTSVGEAAPRPAALAGTLLVTLDGLSEHPLIPDFRIYRVREQDTWAALSERFYGDRSYADRLRQANDDPAALVSGQEILVPVRDFGDEDEARPRLRPWERADGTVSDVEAPAQPETVPSSTVVPDTYVVVAGDSLSVISLKVYGTSRRWEEIFEANDILDDPDELQVGMELRIP